METANLNFPVITFHRHLLRIREDRDRLTTSTTAGLKNGYFNGLLIVDSNGNGLRVKNAKKIRGIGLFWGYNICLNQKIKVELIFEGQTRQVPLDEVKHLVSQSFNSWHGWASRGDFEELRDRVKNAQTIGEIINLLNVR